LFVIPLYDDLPTRRFPWMTVALIVANVIVFVYELSLSGGVGGRLDLFFFRAGFVPYELTHLVDVPPVDLVPPPFTVFSSMFVHEGWLHIIGNMLFLWVFGNNVEDAMGKARFLAFYLLCGIAAAAAQTAIRPDSTVPNIGASGAIAGVLGAYIMLYPRARVLTLVPVFIFFLPIIMLPAWVVIAAWFVLQLFGGLLSLGAAAGGGVAFFAHVGGFIAGLLLVSLFARRRPRPRGIVY
jgi:membrane associated rhomboid family serine protease